MKDEVVLKHLTQLIDDSVFYMFCIEERQANDGPVLEVPAALLITMIQGLAASAAKVIEDIKPGHLKEMEAGVNERIQKRLEEATAELMKHTDPEFVAQMERIFQKKGSLH